MQQQINVFALSFLVLVGFVGGVITIDGVPVFAQIQDKLPDVKSNISLIMTPDLPELGSHDNNGDDIVVISTAVEEPTPIITEEWKNYVSEKHGLSIDYMTNATVTEGRPTKFDPDMDLEIVYPLYRFAVLQQNITTPDLKEKVNRLIDIMTDKDRRYYEYYLLVSGPDLIHIDNETAYTFTLSRVDKETDRADIVQYAVDTYHNKSSYHFMFTTGVSYFDRSENIRNNMINSIKWID